MEPYIILYKKILKWGWFYDAKTLQLFIYFLVKANWESGEFMGEKIERGQLVTGHKVVNRDTGLSRQSYRTCLEKLKSTNEITIKSTNGFSIITICKYVEYQCLKNKSTTKSTTKSTIDQPSINHGVTTINTNNTNNEIKGAQTPLSPKSHFFKKKLFGESEIFDRFKFAAAFPGWDRNKLLHYWEAADTWSAEGNKKVDWKRTILAWEKRDVRDGKTTFGPPVPKMSNL